MHEAYSRCLAESARQHAPSVKTNELKYDYTLSQEERTMAGEILRIMQAALGDHLGALQHVQALCEECLESVADG